MKKIEVDQYDHGIKFQDEMWDVIIIGAGMGGGTMSLALSKAGLKVLLLEKGFKTKRDVSSKATDWVSNQTERVRIGKWPEKIRWEVDGVRSDFYAALGCGTGGSTLLYAAALERFAKSDIETENTNDNVTTGTKWPIILDELKPYYQLVENLFQVNGSRDPLDQDDDSELKTPPKLAPREQHFMESMKELGLNPYRLHVGNNRKENCSECLGHLCQKACKSDSESLCIKPAQEKYGLNVLDRCNVKRLEADHNKIKYVECERNARTIRFKAKIIVLAAGALQTPKLLLKSKNEFWPNGLANQNDLVGRNLMFHISDPVALFPRKNLKTHEPKKVISFKDFYFHEGMKLGSFQSTGLDGGYHNILYHLTCKFDLSPLRRLKPLRWFLKIPAKLVAGYMGKSSLFATILEDYPYRENRVLYDKTAPSEIHIKYHISEDLRKRNNQFRKLLKKSLKTHKAIFLGDPINLNHGHPCGTCRFGVTPENSVLDKNNKAHDVMNLYIVDASFFPTSGGVNPSLTIAANSLRVADKIIKQINTEQ